MTTTSPSELSSILPKNVTVPETPEFTAAQLLAEMRERGARVYRMRERAVFALTNDHAVASWLMGLGAKAYTPRAAEPSFDTPLGGYRRAREGPPEWDLWVHIIPVAGEQTLWEAAGDVVPTVEAEDFA